MLENHNLKTYERRITPLERLFRRSPYSIVIWSLGSREMCLKVCW